MSFHLACASDSLLLSSDRAVIKRRDRVAFADALTLLKEAAALNERAQSAAAEARDAARMEGLAEGRDTARQTLTSGLADIAQAIEAHAETRRADIAEAAFAAARAIVGLLDDTDVMQRIIDRTIARLDGDKPIAVEVAPELIDALAAHLAGNRHVVVRANAEFGPTDCRIRAAQGQIVASLSVQFDALAARWGV